MSWIMEKEGGGLDVKAVTAVKLRGNYKGKAPVMQAPGPARPGRVHGCRGEAARGAVPAADVSAGTGFALHHSTCSPPPLALLLSTPPCLCPVPPDLAFAPRHSAGPCVKALGQPPAPPAPSL